ncbi:protein FAM161A isoform X1 [Desmodus rotundus]|uniref:protein FAM161A isoform X1 n=2 Tax=Desmodus rotundus TaxID=9430 RepID=UPI000D1809EA|nr:protein FAM161A isoform X1 [Desmodus rotundus]
MAASHQAAKPAAYNIQIPVNPNIGARVAQDEREDLLESLAAVVAALEEEEEEEKEEEERKAVRRAPALTNFNTISGMNKQTFISYEDPVDFSDIYHSNEEYFRKLEELKAAHMETMAKLEKMYQNKLKLKEVQPVIIREGASSTSSKSVSEKNSYHPISLITSLSEPDLGHASSLIVSSSEDEWPNLEKEYPEKNRMMSYAKELINNMWTNFSVKEYIQYKDDDFPAVEKTKKKPKEWVPKITVPEPFQMMIREQKKKEENLKSKSDIEMVHELLKKQEEDAECKKKFRANPVPAFVFLPLYHDIVKKNEERRRTMKEKNKEALLASQKPFKFIAREEQKQAIREKQLRDIFKSKKTNRFKARPIPQSTYGSTTNDRVKGDELYRNIKTQPRAQELLLNSSPLPCRSAHRSCAARKPKCPEQAEKLKCKYKARTQTADFGELLERNQKHLSEQKCPKLLTVCKPSDLPAASHASTKREKILADLEADDENLKETHWPYVSLRHKSPVRSPNAKPMPSNCNPPMPTVSSRGREQAIRRSLEEKKMLEEERNRILTKQKQRMKELQKLLTTRAKAYDSHQSLAQISKSRIKSFRKSEKERMREYRQELEERKEKLKNRPLLFERVAQKNARMAAEKHYSNTLKALGISDEFVSKKGQSGKIFEPFSNQEMKSFTEDKESFNEEENVEEREDGEENYFTETNSQDSCMEKDEANEESGEKKSVEE